MQDGYVGDVGDFGKYLLLWNICSPAESDKKLKLGVNWYRTKNDGKAGKHIKYLIEDNLKLKQCCKPHSEYLYDKLKKLLKLENITKWDVKLIETISENRKIEEIGKAGILPEAIFFEDSVPQNDRKRWANKGFEKLKECDVIFFDPDNGLREDDEGGNSIKHIYCCELKKYYDAGKSLVIYQNAIHEKIETQVQKIKCILNKELNKNIIIRALWYHRGTARIFFIIPNGTHKKAINERIDKFVANFEDKKSNKRETF
jgi:hypothetical protein